MVQYKKQKAAPPGTALTSTKIDPNPHGKGSLFTNIELA